MMKRIGTGIILIFLLVACGQAGTTPTETVLPINPTLPEFTVTTASSPIPPTETATPTLEPTAADTPAPTKTPLPVIYGPTNFPAGVNPLTGLTVADPALLNRRPIAVKLNIVPRYLYRPPFGLSLADIVYDYYHNAGYSRFFAIFYGNDADLVGPIRSGRLLDNELVQMYQSIFAYGSADAMINQRFFNSSYSDRLILEGARAACPPTPATPLCRYDPSGGDMLIGSTAAMSAYATAHGVVNNQQNLDGMTFDVSVPSGGTPVNQLYVRYSSDNYVRWDYDPTENRFVRFQDNAQDTGQGEEYVPLVDRLNDQQISADNVVVLVVRHEFYQRAPNEIIEIYLSGSGTGYAFRDGYMYPVVWNRPTTNSVLFLTYPDGTPFPSLPGNTWYQVVGETTVVTQPAADVWRFNFYIP
jgi:hypothetical protein